MNAGSTPSGYPYLNQNGNTYPAPLDMMQYCLFFVGSAWNQPDHLHEAAQLVTNLNAAVRDPDANRVFGQYIVPPNPSPPVPEQIGPQCVTQMIVGALPTETVKISQPTPTTATATISGTITNNDMVYLTATFPDVNDGNPVTVFHYVVTGDTPCTIARALCTNINKNRTLSTAKVTASVAANTVTMVANLPQKTATWTGDASIGNVIRSRLEDIAKELVHSSWDKTWGCNPLGNPNAVMVLVLPPGAILSMNPEDMTPNRPIALMNSLGGIHGHFDIVPSTSGSAQKLYFCAAVWSEELTSGPFKGQKNGVTVEGWSAWQNTCAVLYKELVQFRTDPDVDMLPGVAIASVDGAGSGKATATVFGTFNTGDKLTLDLYEPDGGRVIAPRPYSVQTGDTLTSIASGLAEAITGLGLREISATSSGNVVTMTAPIGKIWSFAATWKCNTVSVNGWATWYNTSSSGDIPKYGWLEIGNLPQLWARDNKSPRSIYGTCGNGGAPIQVLWSNTTVSPKSITPLPLPGPFFPLGFSLVE